MKRIVAIIVAGLAHVGYGQDTEKDSSKENPTQAHLVSTPGQTIDIAFPAEAPEAKTEISWPGGQRESLRLPLAPDGRVRLPLRQNMPLGTAEITLSTPGQAREKSCTVDIIQPERYAEMDALAASVRLKEPLRILYLGDSVTAQRAGRNHADKLQFWLDKYNPGRVTFRNAAVGGDSTRTVWRRFQHLLDPSTRSPQHGQETYDGIFDFNPNLIVIFLGQNDTKSSNLSNFEEPAISPEVQEQSLRSILDLLVEKTDARIVLVSTISPVEDVARKEAESHAAKGREVYTLFGKPALMEAYNQRLQKLAQERGLDYLDVYNPTKNHPDKPSLFRDHVHLTEEGNRFLAFLLLRYFAERTEK